MTRQRSEVFRKRLGPDFLTAQFFETDTEQRFGQFRGKTAAPEVWMKAPSDLRRLAAVDNHETVTDNMPRRFQLGREVISSTVRKGLAPKASGNETLNFGHGIVPARQMLLIVRPQHVGGEIAQVFLAYFAHQKCR